MIKTLGQTVLIKSFIAGVRNDELAIKLLQENFDNLGPAINSVVEYSQALQTQRFITDKPSPWEVMATSSAD